MPLWRLPGYLPAVLRGPRSPLGVNDKVRVDRERDVLNGAAEHSGGRSHVRIADDKKRSAENGRCRLESAPETEKDTGGTIILDTLKLKISRL